MLDELDKRILQELEQDCRISNTKLAKKLKSNKTLINYRIKRLINNEIIQEYKYISNQILLSRVSFGLLLSFKDVSYEEEKQIIETLKKMKQVSWAVPINGRWDAVVVIIEKDIIHFNKILNKIFEKIGTHIKDYVFYIDYEGHIKPHNYLYNNRFYGSVAYKTGEKIILDKIENKTYEILRKNPTESFLKIASKLNKSYDTIKSKFNSLKSKKLLLKPTIKININKLGYHDYMCFFSLSPNPEEIKSFMDYCLKEESIMRYTKCLGHFNIILNIHGKGIVGLKKTIGDIKKKFSNIINDYEIIRIS